MIKYDYFLSSALCNLFDKMRVTYFDHVWSKEGQLCSYMRVTNKENRKGRIEDEVGKRIKWGMKERVNNGTPKMAIS